MAEEKGVAVGDDELEWPYGHQMHRFVHILLGYSFTLFLIAIVNPNMESLICFPVSSYDVVCQIKCIKYMHVFGLCVEAIVEHLNI